MCVQLDLEVRYKRLEVHLHCFLKLFKIVFLTLISTPMLDSFFDTKASKKLSKIVNTLF
jgi:hypothetical protein